MTDELNAAAERLREKLPDWWAEADYEVGLGYMAAALREGARLCRQRAKGLLDAVASLDSIPLVARTAETALLEAARDLNALAKLLEEG